MGNNRTFKKVSESVRRRNYIRQNFGRRWKRKEGDEENSRKKKRNKRHNKSGLAGRINKLYGIINNNHDNNTILQYFF